MFTPSVLLFIIGVLGAFDVLFFHVKHARLIERAECRPECWIHVARGPVYAAQFLLIPNVRLAGAWAYALIALFVVDAAVALADVMIEPASRKSQGGLPPGEYAMHIVLSVLVGAMIHASLSETLSLRSLPTAFVLASDVPMALRIGLGAMSGAVLVLALVDSLALFERSLPLPKPIHVSVRIPTSVERLWTITQDHHIHPRWDHRFDAIIMLAGAEGIRTGTRMLYEKNVLGMTIRGVGRYKLHRPLCQSTFEFGSDDPRSVIRTGVGLWRYRALAGGLVEFSTSYTYEVRWGLFGRLFDRLVFRPLFQRETERSFARLARDFFSVRRPRVLGACGRHPARFEAAA